MSRYGGYSEHAFIADYYDYLPVVAGRADLDFYLGYARQARGTVLELGCGTGRVLIPLAVAGARVVGLDLSAPMLSRCQAKLATEAPAVQQRVRLVAGDITRFDLGERFELILIPFRPFQHLLTVDEQMACLECTERHLAPGGKLIVDFFHTDARRMHDPAFAKESEPGAAVELPDGRRVQLAERIAAFHRAAQCNDVELVYYVRHPDGRSQRLVHAFTVRYFFRFEVEHLLARYGFCVAEVFGNFDRSPLEDDSPEMIFVAEKA